eukprot:gnl/MRDRNA2_/MRDRNA2_33595_c0_seq1.p1 gnl/MRDRNA2_/MRDRNA2_33595_c0~~gnl/MRDRNA2_/MRDRNA2_33595_c0_seq1.p1  ORF type:complete len:310 (+),score=84.84 gnl/MRDRNA2_/MRDRNA2_33595_c0_seq1:105-1034(+)
MAMDGQGLWGVAAKDQGKVIADAEREMRLMREIEEKESGPSGPQYVFLDIRLGGTDLPRMVFELFTEDAPRCSENFRSLCTGERGDGKKMKLHLQGQRIFKVLKGSMFCGGDGERNDGLGKGESIYGDTFDDDEDGTDKLKHDSRGKISFLPRELESNDSKLVEYEDLKRRKPNTRMPKFLSSIFAVQFGPAPEMDKKACVFGQMIQGDEALDAIEAVAVDDKHRPQAHSRVVIIRSGELDKKVSKAEKEGKKRKRDESSDADESDSSTADSSSSSSSKKKKKKKGGKKKKKDKKDKKKDKKKGKKKKK